MSLIDLLKGAITPELLAGLSGQVGAPQQKTQGVVETALPLLVGALANNASKPEGAKSLDKALEKDHDGGILNDIMGFVGNAAASGQGAAILGHVLGSKRPAVEEEVGKKQGIDAAQVGQILVTLAPLLMGALGKMKRDENLDADQVATTLAKEKQEAEKQAPEPSFITKLLDADGDGDVMDDLAKHGATLMGMFGGGGKKA